ncbi:MAG TPA: type II toxin-antitoxin system VapC family toxin [Caulobacteraceae bacterium]|jgi:predicted nucleic acid-binding protein|nr:type II toxin-antitoxin system VapC family toxin [Caulobacteraceae bacterium]
MALVPDASVALKWIFEEVGSDRARALADQPLVAPDFLLLECANVLAIQVRRGLILPDTARNALRELHDGPIRFLPSGPFIQDAHALGVRLGHGAYDCLYLAVAIAERAVMVTADERFVRVVESDGAYSQAIRLL